MPVLNKGYLLSFKVCCICMAVTTLMFHRMTQKAPKGFVAKDLEIKKEESQPRQTVA